MHPYELKHINPCLKKLPDDSGFFFQVTGKKSVGRLETPFSFFLFSRLKTLKAALGYMSYRLPYLNSSA